MALYQTPGVYVEEVPSGARPIEAVGTSTPAFVGVLPDVPTVQELFPVGLVIAVNNWTQLARHLPPGTPCTPLALAVHGFFANGGQRCYLLNVGPDDVALTRISALETVDEIAIVAAPGYTSTPAYEAVVAHCESMRDRVAILDAPAEVSDIESLTRAGSAGGSPEPSPTPASSEGESEGGAAAPPPVAPPARRRRDDAVGMRATSYGAYYFPWIRIVDPITGDVVAAPPSGHLAGVWARSDSTRGVHKAPANEPVRGAVDVTYRVTAAEQGVLNPAGVNVIRYFASEGIKVWGARTLAGSSSEWKYLPVRRLFTMVEESIMKSTGWIVFEPNDQMLWNMIRRDVSAFCERLYRQGALQGRTPAEAFFVKCDAETNQQEEIDAGVVTTLVGLAPVKPAEFIVFRISQSAAGGAVEQEA